MKALKSKLSKNILSNENNKNIIRNYINSGFNIKEKLIVQFDNKQPYFVTMIKAKKAS